MTELVVASLAIYLSIKMWKYNLSHAMVQYSRHQILVRYLLSIGYIAAITKGPSQF